MMKGRHDLARIPSGSGGSGYDDFDDAFMALVAEQEQITEAAEGEQIQENEEDQELEEDGSA